MEEGGGLQGFQLLLSYIIISLISKFHNSVLFISFSTFLLENHAFSFMFKLIFFLPCILKIDFLWKINNKTSNFGVSTAIVNSADISLDGSSWTLYFCEVTSNHAISLKEKTQGDNTLTFLRKFIGIIFRKWLRELFW